ncbi:MAG: hypothetical protein IKB25_09225 [Lentisphaeria bacterium]|nr:hypothetical protein [Lentisphaeria bacterium]
MTKTMKKRILKFTIVEILVAMSVFAILMLIIMQIFGSLQSVWTTTSNRTRTAQNANVIMNMLVADFQSAYYSLDAKAESSWCYYQGGAELSASQPLWFITSRQKSIQSANSAQVLTGYWIEEVKKDDVDLLVLKNLTISNMDYKMIDGSALKTSELFNYKSVSEPDAKLKNVDSSLKKIAVAVDDNIVSFTITPYVKSVNSTSGAVNFTQQSGLCKKLPSYVEIKLQILDDDPSVREAYKDATTDERKKMIRTYTRIIEINRGQYYE